MGGDGGMGGFPGTDGGGGFQGPPQQIPSGGNGGSDPPPQGPITTMDPRVHCFGATGLELMPIIDTGASFTTVNKSTFMKHYSNVPVDTSKQMSMQGVGGVVNTMLGQFDCKLTFEVGGQRLEVSGPCAIYPNDNTADMLIGMPYLRENNMHLTFDETGDFIEIKGVKVPIDMITKQTFQLGPVDDSAYMGSNGKKFTFGSLAKRTSFGHVVGGSSDRKPTLAEQDDLNLARALQESEHDHAARQPRHHNSPVHGHPRRIHHGHQVAPHRHHPNVALAEQEDYELAKALQESEYQQSGQKEGNGTAAQGTSSRTHRRQPTASKNQSKRGRQSRQ